MSFRSIFLILTATALLLSGCDSRIGEEPPPTENQEFSGTKCLSDIGPVMESFMKGEAEDREIMRSWDCVATALNKFKRYVRGRSSDRYTSQEIATFLEDNFLAMEDGKKLPENLQKETMKFKQMFLGGSPEYIMREELDRAIALVGTFRELSVKMNPYMKVFTLNWKVSDVGSLNKDMVYFEKANEEIQNTAKALATVIENNGREYHLQDFVSFVNELSIFFGEDWEFKQDIEKYMPVVKKIKKALAGGDENVIAPKEWRRWALLGARGYVQYLRYFYFIQSVPETGTGYRLAYLSRTVEDIFSVFHDLVGQKPEGVVSREEMNDLLITLERLWPEFRVSPKMILEIMKLKQLFFGGSVDSWNSTDFETARLKVGRIKTLIERFLPYYLVYGKEWDPSYMSPDEAQKFFMEAQYTLESTGREVGSLFEGSYSMSDLEDLIGEIEDLYPPKDPSKSLGAEVRKFSPLLVEAKNIVLGGNDATLQKEQWSPFLGFAARLYSSHLYSHYFINNADLQTPEGLHQVSVFVNQSLNIIRDILNQKKPSNLSREELTRLFERLIETGILPGGIQKDAIAPLIKALTGNLLISPESRLGRSKERTLNLDSVEFARKEFQIWLDTETFLINVFQSKIESSGVTSKELRDQLTRAINFSGSSEYLKTGARELLMTTDAPVQMTVDPEGRLEISNLIPHFYSRKSLQRINVTRAGARLLTRAYAGDMSRVEKYQGVTLPEVQGAMADLKSVLVGMGLLDPKNDSFADSRFREANIFVPHADGSLLASFQEVNDLIGMIWSGVTANTIMQNDLVKFCLGGTADVTNDTKVSVDCVKRAYKGSLVFALPSLPEFQKFLKKAEIRDYNTFMGNVLKAAGYVPNKEGPNKEGMAKLGDVALSSHVIQYIEMIYARFDANKDGYINTRESLTAFPAFKGILLELTADQIKAGDIAEEDLDDVFTYILKFGKPPESWKEKLYFAFRWRNKRDNWDVYANREKIARILGYIADKVAEANEKKISSKPKPQEPKQPLPEQEPPDIEVPNEN
jgi:hypothetical protein